MAISTAISPTPPERSRVSIRLPRPLWIGVAAIVLIALGVGLRIAEWLHRQQVVIREIERLGGTITMRPRGPIWLRQEAGYEGCRLLDEVVEVRLADTPATDATLNHVALLTGLRVLNIRTTHVTDAGLAHLKGLTELEELRLYDTRVTNVGIAEIKRALPKLRVEQ